MDEDGASRSPSTSSQTAEHSGNEIPSGTLTFLFTDVEGSTQRWERAPEEMERTIRRHDQILRSAITSRQGYVVKTIGDAFFGVFVRAGDAVAAAIAAQQALHAEDWGPGGELRVRVALHTGVAEERDGDFFGPTVNRAARLLAAGHGGQVLLSAVTYGLAVETLPAEVMVVDLGRHRLKDLSTPEHIMQVSAPGCRAQFPPLRTLNAHRTNLPVQPSPFIGREQQVAAVRELLIREDVHLLTLTGPGGIGKTRLALQAAGTLLEEYADGVYFVPLAALADPQLVPSAIAGAIGLQDTGVQTLLDAITVYLAEKRFLLILDNFEHLHDACDVAAHLLIHAPHLTILAASRAPLHLSGEQEYPVPALSLPDLRHLPPIDQLTQVDAVALFVQRARAVRPEFTITEDNAAAVAEICHRLDGLPLALELAASRVRLLPLPALLQRLDRRLPLLTGGARDLPTRQQTLRAAIDWSYTLLSPTEQTLFACLSVFVGSFGLEAAESVCRLEGNGAIDVFEGICLLVEQSLVRQEGDGEPRFIMLGTIREYAAEKLEVSGHASEILRRHAMYYVQLAETAEPELRGANQQEWLNRLSADHDNVRAALRRHLDDGNDEAALRLAGALRRFWDIRGFAREGLQWLREGLAARDRRPTPVRAKALRAAGTLALGTGDVAATITFHLESLESYRAIGDHEGAASELHNLGVALFEKGDLTRACEYLDESVTAYRKIGSVWGEGLALQTLGTARKELGDLAEARALLQRALSLRQAAGDPYSIAIAAFNLATAIQDQGNLQEAEVLYTQALEQFRAVGADAGTGTALHTLARCAADRNDYDRALALCNEALELLKETSSYNYADTVRLLGHILACRGDLARAETTLETALVLAEGLSPYLRCMARVDLAWVLGRQGTFDRADRLLSEAMAESLQSDRRLDLGDFLIVAGAVAALQEEDRDAVHLWAAGHHAREGSGVGRPVSNEYLKTLDQTRQRVPESEWQQAWGEGLAMALADAAGIVQGQTSQLQPST